MSQTDFIKEANLNHERAKALVQNLWNILINVPSTLKEHQDRSAALEWLSARLEHLRVLETKIVPELNTRIDKLLQLDPEDS